jgi:hypothetical protein
MSNENWSDDENKTPPVTENGQDFVTDDLQLTAEEEEQLKKKIEELRKRDPFIYR